jgi:phosphoribosylformimino-5-aminoimidazole carboxamide ribonucleotide (ProFAR) isomerase
MCFSVIPAIDVAERRLARWTVDGAVALDAFEGDPVEAARAFTHDGATWLHVVDIDHAVRGRDPEVSPIVRIRDALPDVRIQASGGVLHGDVETYISAGAERVVLGSAALLDEGATEALLAGRGGSVVVGIEVDDGRIRSRGPEPAELDLMETLGWLVAAGAQTFLVTAVARVGLLDGPDLETIRRVVRAGRPVLAAGGFSSLEDLRAARTAGAVGAVVGRAALEGSLDLPAAFDWAAGA